MERRIIPPSSRRAKILCAEIVPWAMYRRAGLCALGRFMDSSATRDDVSRDGETLGELDQQKQDHTQDGERHDAGEQQPSIHAAVCHHEEITEAGVTTDEFAYHCSDHRQRD